MIKTILKHSILERCIDTIFSNLIDKFAKANVTIEIRGADLRAEHIGMRVLEVRYPDFKKRNSEYVITRWIKLSDYNSSKTIISPGRDGNITCFALFQEYNGDFVQLDIVYDPYLYILSTEPRHFIHRFKASEP